jgi:hypothetical protein
VSTIIGVPANPNKINIAELTKRLQDTNTKCDKLKMTRLLEAERRSNKEYTRGSSQVFQSVKGKTKNFDA